jgi:hypothetical protein
MVIAKKIREKKVGAYCNTPKEEQKIIKQEGQKK